MLIFGQKSNFVSPPLKTRQPVLPSGCTRVFKVAAKLRMHDDVVHKNLEGKYKCAYCPKRFWGKSSLREHTNGVHLNTKPHKCILCDFASSYRSKFIPHFSPIWRILEEVISVSLDSDWKSSWSSSFNEFHYELKPEIDVDFFRQITMSTVWI